MGRNKDNGAGNGFRSHVDGASGGVGSNGQGQHLSAPDLEKLESAIRGHVVGPLRRAHGKNGEAPKTIDTADPPMERLFAGVNPRQVLRALLDPAPASFNRILDDILDRHNRLKHVCSYLISPIANELGRMWSEDQASFTQVSLASGRLSIMIQQIAASRRPEVQGKHARSILLARLPGADHTLGLAVVSACFREAGWDVDGGPDICVDREVMKSLRERQYSVFGISVGRHSEIGLVADCIESVSREMHNRKPVFGVGGPAIAGDPESFRSLKADFVATDAWEALSMAEASIE